MKTNVSRRQFLGLAGSAATVMGLGLVGCGGSSSSTSGSDAGSSSAATESNVKVTMVTDMGGVNDQSFNQGAWEGLQQLGEDTGAKVSYTESKQESDYATNLDKAVDDGNMVVWGIGFAMADAVETAAKQNPDVNFAIIDNAYESPVDNLTGVTFHSQEPSFVAGYIAAMTTKTNKVGFVGGMASDVLKTFEFGYKAGVAYTNAKEGKEVEVVAQYTETFTDAAKGKAVGAKLYTDGCDIVFQCAGNCGNGVIEAATEANQLVIGVDSDQYEQAPENMLTSVLKKVNEAVQEVSKQLVHGDPIGGTNVELSMADDAVGISEHHDLMDDEVYNTAMDLCDLIKSGEIEVPGTEDDFNDYFSTL